MQRILATLIALCATFLITPLTVLAAPITVPPGLSPGDQYRLAFVTSTARDDLSSSIADYNAFVTTAANAQSLLAGLGTTWTAIASTDGIDADDNTNTNPSGPAGQPIYNLAGELVAPTNQALWNTQTVFLLHPIGVYPDGDTTEGFVNVWTGTSPVGQASHPLGTGAGECGLAGTVHPFPPLDPFIDSSWIDEGNFATGSAPLPMYALSGVLTVPTPEPSSMVLACLSAAGLAVPALRRCRHCRTRGHIVRDPS